jgi:hypothetical protein
VLQKSAPKQASLPPGDWLLNRRYVRWISFNAAMKQKQLVRTIVWLISCLAPRVLSSWHLSLKTSMHVIFPVGHVMCNHTLLSTTSNASKCVLQNKNRELLLLEEEILLTGESLRWIKEEIFVKETESDFHAARRTPQRDDVYFCFHAEDGKKTNGDQKISRWKDMRRHPVDAYDFDTLFSNLQKARDEKFRILRVGVCLFGDGFGFLNGAKPMSSNACYVSFLNDELTELSQLDCIGQYSKGLQTMDCWSLGARHTQAGFTTTIREERVFVCGGVGLVRADQPQAQLFVGCLNHNANYLDRMSHVEKSQVTI